MDLTKNVDSTRKATDLPLTQIYIAFMAVFVYIP